MKTYRLMIILTGMIILGAWAQNAHALKPPHSNTQNYTVLCSSCHKHPLATPPGFFALTSFDNMCFNAQSGCHVSNPGAKPDGSKKRFDRKDVSNRFKNAPRDSFYATYSTTKKQSSHGWKIPNTNAAAGATNNWAPMREYGDSTYLNLKNRIYCTRCHRAHGDTGPNGEVVYKSFFKADPTGDYLCFQCHASRRIGDATNTNVRSPLPSSISFAGSNGAAITVQPHYSHPVEVNYSSARAKAGKSSLFFKNPTSSFPANPSAKLKLYTTKGGVKLAVVCSTCHGPLHSADSNPYTFDSLSTYSRTGNYSSSAGNLLRRYPMKKSDDICLSCHKVQTHRSFKCGNCHTPHKKAGENNRYLIQENISTPYSGTKAVQFISTSAMAFRYTNSVPGKSAICQACHTGTEKTLNHHYNYSSNTVDRAHNYDQPSGKYLFCPQCHVHSAGFKASGPAACGSCHKSPPNDTFGKHGKHVGTNGTYDWSAADITDSRSSSSYGLSCGRCHSKWAPYTSSANYPRHQPASGFDDDVFGRFTAEVGFSTLSTMTKDPASSRNVLMNPGATYTYGARGSRMDFGNVSTAGTSGSWWSWPSTGTCNNLYCHGQFFNGYSANTPTWQGTQRCGKCHGVVPALGEGIPGKTGSNNWGAHPRHVGNGTQQYGTTAPNFRCNACHAATVTQNAISSEGLDRTSHVNGRTNIQFDAQYGSAASNYGGLNNYSGRTNRNVAWANRTQYKTCGLVYCHSDGSRLNGNYSSSNHTRAWKLPNWSSIKNFTTIASNARRCHRCHGADNGGTPFSGITAAMPGYNTRTGKGNSHVKHVVQNGFMCSVCHSKTVGSDNKSIYFNYSTRHVNKRYDVDILSTYGGTYDSGTHKCSNVKCHGSKSTPAWGTSAVCQDCHQSNTSDTDKRIRPRSKFTSWTSSVPMIYSTQWTERGHGRSSGSYVTGNPAANQACSACHRQSVNHGTSANPFRLLTAPDRPNIVCNRCHGVGGSGASKTGILTHASSVTGGGHNYEIKCIDCHDPHGDNNIFMVHSTISRPGSMARDVSSGKYGIITSVSDTKSNVDFVNNVYTSDYALKSAGGARICQACHDETVKPGSGLTRYQYSGTTDTAHGSGRCVDCHQHSAGFKGAGCSGCHGAPPTGTFNLLSGAGRTNKVSKRASGNSTVFGPHSTHVSVFKAAGMSATEACSACHYSGMWGSGSENSNIDLEFRAFTQYSGTNQEFNSGLGTKSGFYGLSGIGVGSGNDSRCQNMKCHGGSWLTASYGTPTAPKWENTSVTARCGKCHGAKKAAGSGSWPTTKAHARHVGTDSTPASIQYDFMCKLCHSATVLTSATTLNKGGHVNGLANVAFDSINDNRVDAGAYNGDTVVNSGFGKCLNTYCHSRGTSMSPPYDTTALANYTANWIDAPVTNRCKYCHGNRVLNGITAAMPDQVSGNSHRRHVVTEKFRCSFCHANVVNDSGQIISKTNHVNKFKNISIILKYKSGATNYVDGTDKCSNIKCHGSRTTPAWGSTANCSDCHYRSDSGSDADVDNFTFQAYTGQAANATKIYSGEWTKRGHGKTKVSGKYPFSNNTGAGKNCDICHTKAEQHNSGNYFRIRTTATNTTYDPDKLCAQCHGTGSELGKLGAGTFGRITGIKSHSWANMSTYGYTGANNTNGKAGWNFPNQAAKCVDCHDPHGDKNNYMVHRYINMTGSDSLGRPVAPYNQDTVQMNFTGRGTQMTWTSYVNSGNSGLCQRCHSAEVSNFARDKYTTHNQGNRCTNCHSHKKGFTPSGCDACHGYPPGRVKAGPGGWRDSLTNKSSLHQPHAWNPRQRPGIPTAENNQQSNLIPAGAQGYYCNRCHGGTEGDSASNGQDANHGSNINAGMKNMTMVWGDWSKGTFSGRTSVTDDTCKNVRCHTPRYYTRAWKKPVDCDDCHGYRRGKGAAERVFNLQTTGRHKIHINYTGTLNLPGTWKKNYNFACSNCHYNWQTNNNYSTHYNGYVNMTSGGPVNTRGGTFYGRGKSFKGMTTGNEGLTTCDNTYCHGNFVDGNGLPQTINWKTGTVNCGSCHRSAYVDETSMPERHPKHAATAKAGYNFACTRCHNRTTANITTVMFTYSSHVNGRYDIYFDNQGGINNSGGSYSTTGQFCSNIYCHSKGAKNTGPFNNRSGFPNFTAKWSLTPVGYKQPTGQRAKCNFCHGNKIWTGTTSAMPNYSTVRVKANSHLKHVINNRIACSTCHFGITANNTSIANRTAHANSFFNISIDPSFVSAAGKKYSANWSVPKAGGTCKNNTCHGAGTPQWGSSVACFDCHAGTESRNKPIKTAANGPNPVNFQQYTLYGHGRRSSAAYPTSANNGAGKWNNSTKTGCYMGDNPSGCHSPTAGHMTKDPADPFRLGNTYKDTNALCLSCHDGAGGGESALNPAHHSAAQLGSSRTWPFTPKCVDCHDPHGDSNISMIRGAINTPRAGAFNSYTEGGGSGVFGNPTGVFGAISTTTVTFNNRNGKAAGSYASNTPGTGLCEICHSNKISPAINWYNRQGDSNKTGTDHEFRTGACAPTCHNHGTGFKGAGESTGGTQCQDCHDLYTRMRSNTNFHHVMSNSSAVYRGKTSFGATETAAKERRCLQCHVDHDAFNPSVKGVNKRAANLRRNATLLTNKTGIATDFWPAKRAGKYAGTSPISGPSGSNGVCISCHKSVQYKNTTLQANGQGSRSRSFTLALYTSSSHNFQVISGMNKFSDGSRFRPNCSKCHGSYYMNKLAGAQGRQEYGLHDSKYRSLLRAMSTTTMRNDTTIPPPVGKDLCYNCHSRDTRRSYDYYSSVSMDTSAKLIKAAVESKTYGHPVGANTESHKPDESLTAAYGWNIGAGRHVECMDCHNTHGGNASLTRDPGSPVVTGGPNANKVAGAQLGVWGIQTSGTWPTTPGGQPNFRVVGQVTYQYEVCAKCHSKFAWNTQQPPLVPSGGAGFTNVTGYLTDVMREFNPNNYGYHPVAKIGKNQPPKTANTNWPAAKNNLKYYDPFRGVTTFAQVSGLDFAFVPPYNRRSTMTCADCHKSDSTGLAVSCYGSKTVTAWNNWSSTWKSGAKDATLDTLDNYFATSRDTTMLTTDLTGAGGFTKASDMVIAYQARQNVGKSKLLKYKIHKPTGFGTATTINGTITATNKSVNFIRYEANIYAAMSTANCRTPSCLESNVTVETYTDGTKFDVSQAGIDAIYTFTESLRGPHGSMQKWLLASANKDIWVDWDYNLAYTASKGEKPNSDTAFVKNAYVNEENTFCYNCHRRDVYTIAGSGVSPAHTDQNGKYTNDYSRFKHWQISASGGPSDLTSANLATAWNGIWCMVCHGGNGLGKIHGDWAGTTETFLGGSLTVNTAKGARAIGTRLLNGASAHLSALPSSGGDITCYTPGDGSALGACSNHATGNNITNANAYNYNYY